MWPFKKKKKSKEPSTIDKINKDSKELKECYPMGTKIKYIDVDMVVCGYNTYDFIPYIGVMYNVQLSCDYVNSHGELKNVVFSYHEAMNENTALIKVI